MYDTSRERFVGIYNIYDAAVHAKRYRFSPDEQMNIVIIEKHIDVPKKTEGMDNHLVNKVWKVELRTERDTITTNEFSSREDADRYVRKHLEMLDKAIGLDHGVFATIKEKEEQ